MLFSVAEPAEEYDESAKMNNRWGVPKSGGVNSDPFSNPDPNYRPNPPPFAPPPRDNPFGRIRGHRMTFRNDVPFWGKK